MRVQQRADQSVRKAAARFLAANKAAGFRSGLPIGLGTELADFADVAAALQYLDPIITVDTALAHLAGALGVAAWWR